MRARRDYESQANLESKLLSVIANACNGDNGLRTHTHRKKKETINRCGHRGHTRTNLDANYSPLVVHRKFVLAHPAELENNFILIVRRDELEILNGCHRDPAAKIEHVSTDLEKRPNKQKKTT